SSRIGPHMNLNLPFPIACDDKQATLLLTATSGKNPEAVEFLLQQGADPNFNPERGIGPPLHGAAYSNNLPAVRILLRHGPRIEERNDHGLTPLLSAAINSKGLDIILELLAAGADSHAVTNSGDNAVMMAASANNEEAVRLFTSLGIDPCAADQNRGTPADAA